MLKNADTIAAIATAQARGGIGVVRISGTQSAKIAETLLGKSPQPRHAYYTNFSDNQGDLIDCGILLFFSSPHSYTGEDVLELQGHGGLAVLQLLLQRCLQLGARLAESGEFTQRAFLNNKMDLAQAESVADLIEATTAQAARSAMRSLQGDFSTIINSLVADLIRLRMLVEAMLDFPEEDIESTDIAKRNTQLQGLRATLAETLQIASQGSLLREGARVALVGQPNVGKSSLLNCLAGEEVALVSEVPGTTRDVIRREIQIQGVPLHIMDTAGLRESEDVVEKMGMALTRKTLQNADLVIALYSAESPPNDKYSVLTGLPEGIPCLMVYNKIDLATDSAIYADGIAVSAKTGQGIERLRAKLLELLGWKNMDGGIFMARERHLRALREAQVRLDMAAECLKFPELFAEELRLAQEALSGITGKFSADDLLGEIFSRFCIGK